MPTVDGLSLQSDAGRALSSPTIVELFREQVVRLAPRTALRQPVDGVWQEVSWGEYGDAVREIAAGLIDIGVAPGDRVALLATNGPNWHFADLGILSAAAVTVPLYPTSAARQVAYIVDHCEARVAIVENREQLAKILEERSALPKLERVVLFDDATAALDDPFLLSLKELRAIGHDRIVPGEDGLLLQDPRDLDAFGEAVRHLLDEPPYAMQLGKNARARAQAEFLGDRHLEQGAQLFAQLEANKR